MNQEVIIVRGNHTLKGDVRVSGAKNSALKLMAASILGQGETILHNVPLISDIELMSEVLARRYAPERMADERFGARPDLLILDGGKPQLTAAMEQLGELGLDIPMAGLAKSDEELFVPWDDMPVVLPSGSASLYLVKRVRDEAHRFAITFHRELRGKAMTVSILDEIPGVGEKRKRALRRAFGSMKRLREATEAQIAAVPGVPAEVAHEVYETLRAWDEELDEGRDRALGEDVAK